jgi:hypothetical protein
VEACRSEGIQHRSYGARCTGPGAASCVGCAGCSGSCTRVGVDSRTDYPSCSGLASRACYGNCNGHTGRINSPSRTGRATRTNSVSRTDYARRTRAASRIRSKGRIRDTCCNGHARPHIRPAGPIDPDGCDHRTDS